MEEKKIVISKKNIYRQCFRFMKMVINSNMQHNGLILVLSNTISKSTLSLETEKDVNTVHRGAFCLSGGFTIMAVINPPERKPAKRTSVQCFHIMKMGGISK